MNLFETYSKLEKVYYTKRIGIINDLHTSVLWAGEGPSKV